MNMEKRRVTDFFDLLDVDRNATKDEVQKGFMLKASIWHPDKAEKEEDVEYYTKIYQDLQTAYRILSNDSSRKQYSDAQQTTDIEFKNAQRDVGYCETTQFKTDTGKFDKDAFNSSFQSSRDDREKESLDRLHERYKTETPLKNADINDFMARRKAETANIEIQQVFTGTGKNFDSHTFNRAFDMMKQQDPGNGLQLYEGNPLGMFSGGGLAECDPMSGINFMNGFDFTGHNVEDIVLGQCGNPSKDIDLKALQTGEQYGKEKKLTEREMQDAIARAQDHRNQLANMDKLQFIVEPSEIEQQYSELFAPLDVEGLEAPVQNNGTTKKLERDSTNIRKKIDQRKHTVHPKPRSLQT